MNRSQTEQIEPGVWDALSMFVVDSRASINNPNVSLSDPELWDTLTGDTFKSSAGINVTHKKALGYAPLYQAVAKIGGDVAKLPLKVYSRLAGGGRSIDRAHPAADIIGLKANKDLSAFKVWRRLMNHALLWNNGYAWIERDRQQRPIGIYNLLPDRTAPKYRSAGDGSELCFVTESGGKLYELDADDVIHIEGVTIDNCEAEDTVNLFRHDFGIALGARDFTSKFFGNNATVGGVLQVPPGTKPEAAAKVQNSVAQKFTNSSNAFKTIVLRDGYRWFQTQIDPGKASVSKLNEDQTRAVAQMYNLDPSHLGVKGSVAYNSREAARSEYHEGCLSHWLFGIKTELNLHLLTDEERQGETGRFIDYNVNALMWTDAKSRSEIATKGIQVGRFSPNEVREWDNLAPFDGGDKRYRMSNLEVIDGDDEPDVGSRAESEDNQKHMQSLLTETLARVHGRFFGLRSKHTGTDLFEVGDQAARSMLKTPALVAGIDPEELLSRYREQAEKCRDDKEWHILRNQIGNIVSEVMK